MSVSDACAAPGPLCSQCLEPWLTPTDKVSVLVSKASRRLSDAGAVKGR
jgi:hypothetical protein